MRRVKPQACTKSRCTTRFSSRRDLRRHVKSKHDLHHTACSRCSKPLRTCSDNLKRHMDRYCKGGQRIAFTLGFCC
ncbi:hypothetical protein V8F20_012225 [Naviculisporaceae sp. PSN 640]